MMPRCRSTRVLLLAAVLLGPGCGDQEQQSTERAPEFSKIEAAPSNVPMRPVKIMEPKRDSVPLLPRQGVAPLVRMMLAGRMLEGEYRLSGTIIRETADEIRFVPKEGSEIRIGVLLPTGMRLAGTDGAGGLYVNERSSLRGADQTLTIQTLKGLLLGSVWRVDGKPIAYTPVPGVVITQIALPKEPPGNTLQPVEVSVTTSEGRKIVPLGQLYTFGMGGKKYTMYLNTSHFQGSDDEGDDVRIGYILRGMIVGE